MVEDKIVAEWYQDYQQLRKVIYGNGQPGVLEMLRDVYEARGKTLTELNKMVSVVYGDEKVVGLLEHTRKLYEETSKNNRAIATRDRIMFALFGTVLSLISGLLWGIFTGRIVLTFVG